MGRSKDTNKILIFLGLLAGGAIFGLIMWEREKKRKRELQATIERIQKEMNRANQIDTHYLESDWINVSADLRNSYNRTFETIHSNK